MDNIKRIRTGSALCVYLSIATAIFLWDSTSAHPTSGSSIIEKLKDIETKVDAIDEKVDILLGEGEAHELIDSINNTLDGIDKNLGELSEKAKSETPDNTDDGAPTEARPKKEFVERDPIKLISVERTSIDGQHNQFVVKFIRNSQDMVYRVHEMMGKEKAPESVALGVDGEAVVSFTLGDTLAQDPNSWETSWFIISDGDYSHTIALQLNNTMGLEPASYEAPDLPEIHVSPPHEAVYQPGEDVLASVYLTGKEYGEDEEDLGIYELFSGVDLKTQDYYNYFESEGLLNSNISVNPTTDRRERTVTVLTSSRPVSGYLQFDYQEKGGDESLVPLVQVGKCLVVRPASQTQILPRGYLSFAKHMHMQTSTNGNDLTLCRVGTECRQLCQVVGENITGIQVFQLDENGSPTQVSSAVISPVFHHEMRTIAWTFEPRADSGDADGITTFRCEAYGSHKTATTLLDIQAVLEAEIVEDASRVIIEDDKMDPDIKVVTLSCTVTGRPLPNVTFTWNAISSNVYDGSPDRVTKYAPTTAQATKTIRVNTDELERAKGYTREQSKPSCSIRSPVDWSLTSHTLNLPE